jgi:hypothetical protein
VYLIWEAMSADKRADVVEFFDSGQLATLHFLWRGKANQKHTQHVAADRAEFLVTASVEVLAKFWAHMTGTERSRVTNSLDPAPATELFGMLSRSDKITTWRFLDDKEKLGIWNALTDVARAEFEEMMAEFTCQLQSISIDGKFPLDYDADMRENAFRSTFADIQKTTRFVSIAEMKERLKVSEQTVRTRAQAYGFTVRRGDIHPPILST